MSASDTIFVRFFEDTGDFAALRAAEAWCRERGVSYGSQQRSNPIGLLVGDFLISKWTNMSMKEQRALHGTISGDMRNGPVVLRISRAALEYARTGAKFPDSDPLSIGVVAAIGNCAHHLREGANLPLAAEQMEAAEALADAMVETLKSSRAVIATALRSAAPDMFATDQDVAEHLQIKRIDAVLARAEGRYSTPSGHDIGCVEHPPGHASACSCGARTAGGAQ